MADPIIDNPMSDSPDSNYLFQVKERDDRATFQSALNEMAQSQRGGGASGAKPAAQKPAGPEQSTLGKIGEVAKNTAYGAVAEVVPQLIAGRFDAVRHAGMAVKDVGDWLDTNAPWLSGMTAEEMAKRKAEQPTVCIDRLKSFPRRICSASARSRPPASACWRANTPN